MEMTVIIGVLAACYGASRIALRLGVLPASIAGLRFAHLGAAFAVLFVDFLLKYTWGGFTSRAALWIVVIQFCWYLLDRKRGRLPARLSG